MPRTALGNGVRLSVGASLSSSARILDVLRAGGPFGDLNPAEVRGLRRAENQHARSCIGQSQNAFGGLSLAQHEAELLRIPACGCRFADVHSHRLSSLVSIVVNRSERSDKLAFVRVSVGRRELMHKLTAIAKIPPLVHYVPVFIVSTCHELELSSNRTGPRIYCAGSDGRRIVRNHLDVNRHNRPRSANVIGIQDQCAVQHAGSDQAGVERNAQIDALARRKNCLARRDLKPSVWADFDG